MPEKRRDFLLNTAYFAVWAALVAGVAYILLRWALPVVLAAVTAVALHRPQRWLTEKTHISRRFFSVLLVCTLVAAAGAALVLLGWRLAVAVGQLLEDGQVLENLSGSGDAVRSLVERLAAHIPTEAARQWVLDAADAVIGSISEVVSGTVTSLAAATVSFTATNVPKMLLSFFVWFLASVFILIDYDGLRAAILVPFSAHNRTRIEAGVRLCTRTAGKMVGAYGLLMLITAVQLGVGLSVLRVEHAVGLAALIAVIDVLPVLGCGTVLVPWGILQLLSGDAKTGVGLLVLYAVITVVRNLVEPRLVSHRLGAHPLLTLSLMYVGFRLAGVAGVLLFPFAGTIAVQLYKQGLLFNSKSEA